MIEDWKAVGCVPDSDDDDLELGGLGDSFDSTKANTQVTNIEQSLSNDFEEAEAEEEGKEVEGDDDEEEENARDSDSGDELTLPGPSMLVGSDSKTDLGRTASSPSGNQMAFGIKTQFNPSGSTKFYSALQKSSQVGRTDLTISNQPLLRQSNQNQARPANLWIQVPARVDMDTGQGSGTEETQAFELKSHPNEELIGGEQVAPAAIAIQDMTNNHDLLQIRNSLDTDASPPDSPLSSLSSDSARWDNFRLDAEERLQDMSSKQDPMTIPMIDPETLAEFERKYAGIRSLRKRNPIQLHPYLLEGEQYKRTMHSRGIQAVRARQERSAHESRIVEDSNLDDTQAFQPSSQASSVEEHQLETREGNRSEASQVSRDDSMIPQLDDLLPRQRSRLSRPKKRRKLLHESTTKATSDLRLTEPHLLETARSIHTTLPTPGQSDDIEGPRVLTPRLRALSALTNGFRMPPVASSLQLQTPAKSPQAAREPLSLPSSPPESPDIVPISAPRRRRTITIEASEESERDSSPSKPTNRRATKLQKRTRGVLPASWTTINLQQDQQTRQAQRDTSEQANGMPEQQRGVAKRLKHNHTRPNQPAFESSAIQVFSDDEDDSGPSLPSLHEEHRVDSLEPIDKSYIWPDSDDMEDNAIDTMTGSTAPRQKGKKQEAISKPIQKRLKQTRISSHLPQQKRVPQSRKAKQPRRLGILDVNEKIQDAPDFIRVAARTARTHPTRGRTSPTRKTFRLQNREDHRELQKTLEDWRNDLQSDEQSQNDEEAHHRNPLHPISSNERREPSGSKASSAQGRAQTKNKPAQRLSSEQIAPRPQRPRDANNVGKALQYAAAKADIIRSMKTRPMERADQRHRTRKGVLAAAATGQYPTGPAQLSSVAIDDVDHHRLRFAPKDPPQTVADQIGAPAVNNDEQRKHDQQGLLNEDHETESSHPRIARKRKPRQMRMPAFPEFDSEPGIALSSTILQEEALEHPNGKPLQGLESVQASHSLCFGIEMLPSGPHFGYETFVGSGRFSSCLLMDREEDSTRLNVIAGETIAAWNVWNDKVQEQLLDQLSIISRSYSSCDGSISYERSMVAASALEDIAGYFSAKVCFADAVDRNQLLQTVMLGLQELIDGIQDGSQRLHAVNQRNRSALLAQILSRAVLIAHQLQAISKHHVVLADVRSECQNFLSMTLRTATDCFAGSGLSELQRFLKTREDLGSHDLGAMDPRSATAESFVMVANIARAHSTIIGSLWNHLGRTTALSSRNIPVDVMKVSVAVLEQRWHTLYTFLPLVDLDEKGKKTFNSTSLRNSYDWTLVKRLVKPVLDGYELGLTARLAAFNRYCRLMFRRCFDLIDRWEWRGCDSIVGFLFDFFARNRLANLKHEPSHGSPAFLQNLRDDLRLSLAESDTCFDILLKVIGTGIKRMRDFSPEKKVRDLVWRLIPNHDRRHPKDQEVRQEDLDATRNHHNLLCTLFWAAPPSQRPNVKLIRNLVEDEGSHRQAYHTNIRAWSNLVNYQIVSDCTRSSLDPFNEWATDLLDRLLRQHALARTEVEMQVQQSMAVGGIMVDHATQERAIEANQKQVEAIIRDLLLSLGSAIKACPTSESSSALLCQSIAKVLNLNKTRHSRIDKTIMVALETIQKAVRGPEKTSTDATSQANVDSQGLDWTMFDEDPGILEETSAVTVLDNTLYSAVHSLLLSCLNDHWVRPDDFLVILVQTWASIAVRCVETGQKSWDNFMGHYGHDTWAVIGDTSNRRRYTPFFLSHLLEHNHQVYEQQSEAFVGSWIESLVERESQVKYQGNLTARLLDRARDDPLFTNLPFAKNATEGYTIPMEMIIQRRASLLFSVFSNMRVAVSPEACPDRVIRSERLSQYQELLKRLMSTMRARFQELGEENEAQSAYVTFVHSVVQALQEHVQAICPVDPFFTSSALFPLPAGDPSYVTSKLRAYGLRLHERSVPKQLAVFLNATIERAVHDGQQDELVQWITEAGSTTRDKSGDFVLRSFLLVPMLAAYTDGLARTACGWLLAEPVFKAAQQMLESMGDSFDGCNRTQAEATTSVLESVLGTLLETCSHTLAKSQESESCSVLLIHTLDIARTMLPLIDYLMQLDFVGRDSRLEGRVRELIVMVDYLHTQHEIRREGRRPTFQFTRTVHRDEIEAFARKEVQDSLHRFKLEGGQCYARRNAAWKVMSMEGRGSLSTPANRHEKEHAATKQFDAMVDRMPCVSETAMAAMASIAAAAADTRASE